MINGLVNTEMDWDLLAERFPDLSFLLSLDPTAPLEVGVDRNGFLFACGQKGALYREDLAKELKSWRDSLFLSGVDILYIYGIGLGYHYQVLKEWLHERKERLLVFIEDDIAVLKTLFSLEAGKEILQDRQVHIRYLADTSRVSWERILEASVHTFLSDKVDLTAMDSYMQKHRRKVSAARLFLLRMTTLLQVGMTELIHYAKLMKNIGKNSLSLPDSFHVNQLEGVFQGIPAVICGAGVSLAEAIPHLKTLGCRALIFAGGSAITALGYHGVRPHIAMALDPNREEYDKLKGNSCFEVPFIYSSRLHPEVLTCTNVRPGYLYSHTGGAFEDWMHQQLEIPPGSLGPELGMEALSVTTLAVPLAQHLGCNPIIFCGVDLSYRDYTRYVTGVIPSSEVHPQELKQRTNSMDKTVRKKNREGKMVTSLVKWVMEASCIGSYAKKKSDVAFFNTSSQGLPMPGIPWMSFEEVISKYCEQEYDLRGQLHLETELTQLKNISKQNVEEAFGKLQESFCQVLKIFEQMLQEIAGRLEMVSDLSCSLESGRMSLLQMDLEDSPAYQACLHYAFAAYEKILDRGYSIPIDLQTVEGRRQFLCKKQQLWQECHKIALEISALLVEL